MATLVIHSDKVDHAIRAAKEIYPQCGRWAALRYCINNKVNLSLYRLARQLEAMK